MLFATSIDSVEVSSERKMKSLFGDDSGILTFDSNDTDTPIIHLCRLVLIQQIGGSNRYDIRVLMLGLVGCLIMSTCTTAFLQRSSMGCCYTAAECSILAISLMEVPANTPEIGY